jgi:lipooligosaccharide transport system permease protein
MREGLLSVTPAFGRVWMRNAQVYLALWKFNVFPALAEPILFIFVFGLGIGSYIDEMEGVPYLEFVAPGILGIAAIMQATFECTYGSYFRMRMQNTFEGIISTPVSAAEVGAAEIAWGATRGLVTSVLVLSVLAVFGVFHSLMVLLIPLLTFLAAFNFAAIAIIVTSRIAQMEYFHFYFAGFVLPAQFLCGTFFPVSRFPAPVQAVAWVIPLTSFVDVMRSLTLDRLSGTLLPETVWALVSTLILTELAVRSMQRRLVT